MSFNAYVGAVSKEDTYSVYWTHALTTLAKHFPEYDEGIDRFALIWKPKVLVNIGAIYHDEARMRVYDMLRSQFSYPLLAKGTDAYESYYCCDNYHNEVLLKTTPVMFKYLRDSIVRFVVNDYSEMKRNLDNGKCLEELLERRDEELELIPQFDEALDEGEWRSLGNFMKATEEGECLHALRMLYEVDLKKNDLMLYGI